MATRQGTNWLNKPPIGYPVDRSQDLGQGLIGCWVLNEMGGQGAFDSITGLLGTVKTGTTRVSTPKGPGLLIPTTSRSAVDTNGNFLTGTGDFSLAALVLFNTGTLDGNIHEIISYGSFAALRAFSANTVGVSLVGSGGTVTAVTSETVTENVYYHVVGTYIGTTLTCYLNGIPGASQTTDRTASTQPLWLGGNGTTFITDGLGGYLIYAYVWNRGLSQGEVTYLQTYPYSMFRTPNARARYSPGTFFAIPPGGGLRIGSSSQFIHIPSYVRPKT